jgi:hypothetical protein
VAAYCDSIAAEVFIKELKEKSKKGIIDKKYMQAVSFPGVTRIRFKSRMIFFGKH